jgi:prevent-host-death family protein
MIMKTLTVTEVARNFSAVMDGVEADQEEIVVVRNSKPVARLVPEPPAQNALEVLGDLYRTLDDNTAEALADAVNVGRRSKRGTLNDLRNPWGS